ncbi:MAG: glycoside hydrolase family 78 protein [Bacilli bacterium]|nr:glycoside hydrolase family 78 protein [Bacilli bacterium]
MFRLSTLSINQKVKPFVLEAPFQFAWTYEQDDEVVQASYRVIVSSNEEHTGDYWDTGVITSDKMNNILYAGKEIPSRKEVFVKVMTVSSKGETSEITNKFETTLSEDEWKGKWVSVPDNFTGGTLRFRKVLELKDKPVKRARAYILGLGYHEFYVNGKKVGDAVLNPGVTEYSQTQLYDVYDFLPQMEEHKSTVIGIEVGYGWLGDRKLLAQFYVEYEDGEVFEDHSTCCYGWWVTGSPTIENSIYGGETYDARMEETTLPNWTSREFEPAWDNGWMYTILTQPVVGKKVLQQIPHIRVLGTYKGEIVNEFGKNDLVFDIKQNIAGWARIKVKGNKGTTIVLKFAEGLAKDGHANQLNLRSARCIDKYILKGEGVEEWAPRFTYHGFQYVEVLVEGEAEVLELTGELVHTDNREVGFFKCDDELINTLHHMAKITEANNQTSIFTDCPQRDERFGWLNDLSARVFQQTYNFDVDLMYNKVDHDITETQDKYGCIADTAPYYTGGQPADTTTVSYLLVAYMAHKYYGDIALAKKEYDNHKAWVDYLLTRQKDYVMDYYYYADWVNPDKLEDSWSDSIFVSSLFLNWHLQVMAELARITGHIEDAKKYNDLALASKKSLNEKYYHEEGYYSRNRQTENAMAVSLGVCEEANKAKVIEHVVENIIKNNYHLTCGNQGYRHVFYMLCEYGYSDLALKVLRNPEYPGWGFMVKCGATTVWERWEQEMFNIMDSFDHPMFGSYDAIFYRYIGGIQIEGVGADKTVIHPCFPDSLNHVECSFDSVRGKFVSNWDKKGEEVEATIVVPANTTATLVLDLKNLTVNEKVADSTLVVNSGTYHIKGTRK